MSVLALGGPLGAQANPGTVTITKHADLGFTTSVPVDVDTGVASPPCLLSFVGCLFHGAVAFHGTLKVDVTLGTDVALTYDSSALNTPTAPLPVSVKYTPLCVNGSTVTYGLSGPMRPSTSLPLYGCPTTITAQCDVDTDDLHRADGR